MTWTLGRSIWTIYHFREVDYMELILWLAALFGNIAAAIGTIALLIICAKGVIEDANQEREIQNRGSGD